MPAYVAVSSLATSPKGTPTAMMPLGAEGAALQLLQLVAPGNQELISALAAGSEQAAAWELAAPALPMERSAPVLEVAVAAKVAALWDHHSAKTLAEQVACPSGWAVCSPLHLPLLKAMLPSAPEDFPSVQGLAKIGDLHHRPLHGDPELAMACGHVAHHLALQPRRASWPPLSMTRPHRGPSVAGKPSSSPQDSLLHAALRSGSHS